MNNQCSSAATSISASSMDALGDSIRDEISNIEGIGANQTLVSFYHYEGKAGSIR